MLLVELSLPLPFMFFNFYAVSFEHLELDCRLGSVGRVRWDW